MIYEFRCKNGHLFEVRLRVKECNKPQRCPECGEMGYRQFSTFRFNMKNWRDSDGLKEARLYNP